MCYCKCIITTYNNPITIPSLQMKTLRHTEDKSHAESHRVEVSVSGI